ncbi:hypothetical protein BASA61_004536 [Batrachochytrium salamandrivorans]|nr:hypothetical protein BASA61_004536 [Batrachochytrium salamandrivorans]KAH9265868.1 hypothetical protein BASA83_010891 [Batrachochytrium salamandrivorans]
MRVKALVVATAMVIASVNAGLINQPRSEVKNSGDKSGPGSPSNSIENGLLLSTSIAHLVVECEQVTGHRIQSGLVPAIQKSRLRLLGRALDPGVENVYTWLRGGVLNGRSRSGPALVGRDCGA